MRRSIDQAFLDLRQQIIVWARGDAKPDVRVFVYAPEWEAVMLQRFPTFAREMSDEGCPIEVVDVEQGFAAELLQRPTFIQRATELETRDVSRVLRDLGTVATRFIERVLTAETTTPCVCRLLVNTGSLATFTSYSAITNGLQGRDVVRAPAILAFPGEGDERSLNLLHLRVDTNYRVPRI